MSRPDAIGLLIFVGGPMILSLSLGFFSVSGFGEYSFVGLANYRRMAADPLFWKSLSVTMIYIVTLVPSLYVTGLGLALLVQSDTRFNGVVRSLLFMPQTVSLVVVGLVWQVHPRRQDRGLQSGAARSSAFRGSPGSAIRASRSTPSRRSASGS